MTADEDGQDGTASLPDAADFDAGFAAADVSPGLRQVQRAAQPDLPELIEPYSFLSTSLLDHLVRELRLAPGQQLVDLACGRGGPGLWLAAATGAVLTGVDFSAVAVEQATRRSAAFDLARPARFRVGELTRTGLPDATADAVVCVDALHFAPDVRAAAAEVLRILKPGGRLVFTNWQPRRPDDPRLPARRRSRDWAPTLRAAGFTGIVVTARPEWHEAFTRLYRTALEAGDPRDDTALATFQEEARRALLTAHLLDRVAVSAVRPPGAAGADQPGAD